MRIVGLASAMGSKTRIPQLGRKLRHDERFYWNTILSKGESSCKQAEERTLLNLFYGHSLRGNGSAMEPIVVVFACSRVVRMNLAFPHTGQSLGLQPGKVG